MKELPVIFRKLGNGEVIALFPTLPGEAGLKDTSIRAYTHSLKHTEVDKSIMRTSTEATAVERESLLIEVVKAYSNDQLIIRKRITGELDTERHKHMTTEQLVAA